MIREGRCQSSAQMRHAFVPQISLAYLARQLLRQGWEVRLRDAIAEATTLADVVAEVKDWRPRLVFLNTSTPTIHEDLRAAAVIKEACPAALLAAFGAHATALHEDVLTHSALDAVIRGEPEMTGAAIAGRLREGRTLRGLSGITHRQGSQVIVEDERVPVPNLDDLGVPARELLPNGAYIHPLSGKRYTTVCVSRGCPFRCTFCVAPLYQGRRLRLRGVEHLLDEIEHDVLGGLGVNHLWFLADDLTADRAYLRRICRGLIERRLGIRWWGNTRADVQDQELFDLMARAGCSMLSIGAESADAAILARSRKDITPEDLPRTTRMLARSGILSLAYFIVGLPGESLLSLRRTVQFAVGSGADFAEFYPAIPYPGTELREETVPRGSRSVADYSGYDSGGTRPVLPVDGLSPERVEAEIRRAYALFYARPRPALSALSRVRSLDDFKRLAAFGWGYMKRFAARSVD